MLSICKVWNWLILIVRISGLLIVLLFVASVRFLGKEQFHFLSFKPSIQALQMHGPVCKCPVRKSFLRSFQRTSRLCKGLHKTVIQFGDSTNLQSGNSATPLININAAQQSGHVQNHKPTPLSRSKSTLALTHFSGMLKCYGPMACKIWKQN